MRFAHVARPAFAVLVAAAFAPIVVVGGGGACDGSGTFDGGVGPDGGFIDDDAIDPADVGKPCSYNPADPSHPNPANQCANKLDCLIVTSDNRYDFGLALPAWEDQFTVFNNNPESQVGFCTLHGDARDATFVCPAPLAGKILSPNIAMCMQLCDQPGDCGRDDYTCDVRYFDVPETACVRKCQVDVPDCVRSGITADPANPANLFPALVEEDLRGGAQCIVSGANAGLCAPQVEHPFNPLPGSPCGTTGDCGAGADCIQAAVLNAALALEAGTEVSQGFCASPCTPDATGQNVQSNCTDGFVCQGVAALDLGFLDPQGGIPGPIAINLGTGQTSLVGGYCFHSCTAAIQGSCDTVDGTRCAALNEGHALDTWNQQAQCLPEGLAL